MICTKITVKYLLRILTITTSKHINSILISRNANPQDGCGGIIIYHKLASVLHSRSCRYALDINTDLSSLSFADVPEITAMIKKRFCATLLPFTFWQRRCFIHSHHLNSCQEIVHALLVIKHHDLKKDFQSRYTHTNFSLLIIEVIDAIIVQPIAN